MPAGHYNEWMFALRYTALLALTVWVGGLLSLGAVAAPAIFDVVAAQQIAEGRLVSGAIFGEILRRFHHVSYVCGCLVPLSLVARGVLGPRPRRFAVRMALSVLMLGAVAYSGLALLPRIEALRTSSTVAPSSLPESDPRRIEFGRLHGFSTGLQIIPVIGGLLLLFWELRD